MQVKALVFMHVHIHLKINMANSVQHCSKSGSHSNRDNISTLPLIYRGKIKILLLCKLQSYIRPAFIAS